jgi:hypothetical protein
MVFGLPGPDADCFLHVQHENLSVADTSGARGLLDRLQHRIQTIVGHDNLKLHLRQEIHDIFCAAIELSVALLAPEPLCLCDGDALDADFLQGVFHLIELERLDDRFDLFHARSFRGRNS